MDPLEAGLVGDELIDVINNYGETRGVVVGRGAEPWTCLQSGSLYFNGLGDIEEARLATDLAKMCLSECLLHNNIEQSMHNIVVLHLSHRLAREKGFVFNINKDSVLYASKDWVERYRLSEICSCEDRAARLHPEPQDCIHLLLELLENALHDVRVAHVIWEDRHIILVDREILAEAELELISHQGYWTRAKDTCLGLSILISNERHHDPCG